VAYRVVLTPAAQRLLDRQRGVAFVALRGVILGLADEPRPPGTVKLAGQRDLWRLRLSIEGRQWRIVFTVDERERSVVVTRIARRDEGTYRRL
jgi:mRNA interferase RelE/StbE